MSAETTSKYETLAVLGTGGMATVFVGRARGPAGLRRLVAIKRAHTYVRDHGTLAASMRAEAGLLARLNHPNVVRVLDVVDEVEDLVLVLDYVEGGSLAELLACAQSDTPLDTRTRARAVVRILLDVAAGLDAAHRAVGDDGNKLGIVHRDVSPSNVLVGSDGIARLTDFGIAKALEPGSDRTDTGELKGKIAYMAPEYIEHQRTDAAGDQFSLGVVAWEALTGQRLFRGPTEVETMRRVVSTRVPSLAGVDPVLAPVENAVARALARTPEERFASVRDFAEALEARARAADLVASHAEVGQLVERVLHAELAERRRAVREGAGAGAAAASGADAGAGPGSAGEVRGGGRGGRGGRDEIATASLPGLRAPASVAPSASAPGAGASAGTGAGAGARRPLSIAIAAGLVLLSLGGAFALVAARRGRDAEDAASAPANASASANANANASASASASTNQGEGESAAAEPAAAPPTTPPVTSAPSTVAPSRARPSPATGRRTGPAPSLVPRKAPPNPYLR